MVLVQNVSKVYHLYRHPTERLRQLFRTRNTNPTSEFWALRNVSLHVEKGEILGVMGPNGSGKSTLLQVVSGIVQPTAGRVITQGRVAALLELGAGFNPEFTGRENVYMNGEILGLSRKEVERIFSFIESFAEIGRFIDRPVKEYSSGMYVRLAFATAIHVEPEVLIVDEALAVGDAIFANRCIQKLEELKERKVTILFVSHDLGLVKRLSERAIFMVNGSIVAEGSSNDVVNRYVGFVLEKQRSGVDTNGDKGDLMQGSFRHGDGSSRILDVALLGPDGEPSKAILAGDLMTIRIKTCFREAVAHPVVGILIRNRLGMDIFGTNTRLEEIDLGVFEEGRMLEVEFSLTCNLTRQEYTLTVAVQHADGSSRDWVDDALSFAVVDAKDIAGVVNLRPSITWRVLQAN